MFNPFNRTKDTSDPQGEEYTEAVILTVPLESGLDLGSADEHDGVIKLEEELESIVHSNEIVDGHEFGEETAILYLYGPSADELFDRVKGTLKNSIFNRFEVNLRYGPVKLPFFRTPSSNVFVDCGDAWRSHLAAS